jgi:hypothetical protein
LVTARLIAPARAPPRASIDATISSTVMVRRCAGVASRTVAKEIRVNVTFVWRGTSKAEGENA